MGQSEESERQWEWLKAHLRSERRLALLRLVEAASLHPELRCMFPFLSLERLRFSRTTVFPYSLDLPYAKPIGENRYEVRAGDGEPVGEYPLDQAIDAIAARLI